MEAESLTDLLKINHIERSDFFGVYFILPAVAAFCGISMLYFMPRSPVVWAAVILSLLFPVFIWGTVLVAFLSFFLKHLFGPPMRKTQKFLVELMSEQDNA